MEPGDTWTTASTRQDAMDPALTTLLRKVEVVGVRAVAERHPSFSLLVAANLVNPGLCHS